MVNAFSLNRSMKRAVEPSYDRRHSRVGSGAPAIATQETSHAETAGFGGVRHDLPEFRQLSHQRPRTEGKSTGVDSEINRPMVEAIGQRVNELDEADAHGPPSSKPIYEADRASYGD